MTQKKAKKVEFFLTLGLVLSILVGVGAFSYPMVMNALNDQLVDNIVEKEAQEMKTKEQLAEQMTQRQEVARKKALNNPYSKESLEELRYDPITTSIYAKHLIGEIYLPSIRQALPIFDNSSEQFLQRGATWLATSSQIFGGKGHHSIVAGHSGIPTAKLFNDVPRLAINDLILYKVGKEYHAYKIFKKIEVLPNDEQSVQKEEGRDLTTLVTCVPIGINSRRLLVTGERVAFTPSMLAQVHALKQGKDTGRKRLFLLLAGGLLLLLLLLIYSGKKAFGRKREK